MGYKVDNIVAKFPVKVFPQIIGERNYETINEIVQYIYVNASNLLNALVGDKHGHIGIIMNPTIYPMIAYTVYAAPADPGTVPNTPGTVMTTERMQQQEYHTVAKKVYKNHTNMNAELNMLITNTVEDCFFAEQRNRYMGYLSMTSPKLVEHLVRRYINITASNMYTNKACMEGAIEATQKIDG